jgi:hypothetical protein
MKLCGLTGASLLCFLYCASVASAKERARGRNNRDENEHDGNQKERDLLHGYGNPYGYGQGYVYGNGGYNGGIFDVTHYTPFQDPYYDGESTELS